MITDNQYIPNRRIFRRFLSNVRHGGVKVQRHESRYTSGPDDRNISTCNQMYFPEIRTIGNHRKTRRSLRPSFERDQRENLYFPMVLARRARRNDRIRSYVQHSCCITAKYARGHIQKEIQIQQQIRHQCSR